MGMRIVTVVPSPISLRASAQYLAALLDDTCQVEIVGSATETADLPVAD
jgi:hypothetical protein